jgi:hypothetical protein
MSQTFGRDDTGDQQVQMTLSVHMGTNCLGVGDPREEVEHRLVGRAPLNCMVSLRRCLVSKKNI